MSTLTATSTAQTLVDEALSLVFARHPLREAIRRQHAEDDGTVGDANTITAAARESVTGLGGRDLIEAHTRFAQVDALRVYLPGAFAAVAATVAAEIDRRFPQG